MIDIYSTAMGYMGVDCGWLYEHDGRAIPTGFGRGRHVCPFFVFVFLIPQISGFALSDFPYV